MLALAALLVSRPAPPHGGLPDLRDPLLAFDVVDALDGQEAGASGAAVDQSTAESADAAQGQRPAAGAAIVESLPAPAPRHREPALGADRPGSPPPPSAPSQPTPAEPSPAVGATSPESSPPAPASPPQPNAALPTAERAASDRSPTAGVSRPASGAHARTGGTPAEGAPAGGAGDPASSGAGGGPRRDRRPDVLERFNHDLPSLAFGVSVWAALPPGASGAVTIVLALDERGEVVLRGDAAIEADRCELARAEPPDARCARTRAVYESARRTVDGLYGRFELPGARLGAGRVRLSLVATLSDSEIDAAAPADATDAPVELASTVIADRRASAHFVRSDGRRVDFALQLLAVESTPAASALTDPPGRPGQGGTEPP